jgi:hypothetical protein
MNTVHKLCNIPDLEVLCVCVCVCVCVRERERERERKRERGSSDLCLLPAAVGVL